MKRAKKITITITNDIVTDQRVLRVASYLHEKGYSVVLIGRKRQKSLPIPNDLPYQFFRLQLFFNRGPLFYIEYNLRLFGLLLSLKKTHLLAVDLDTLLPNYLNKILRPKTELIYDAHEYFTEVPELINRPKIQKIWKFIERNIVPKLKKMITVNDSIAQLYENEYQISVEVLRNIGHYPENISALPVPEDTPPQKNLIILQGAGINVDRGAEEALLAMKYLQNTALMIVGGGDALPELKKMSDKEGLQGSVFFYGKKSLQELLAYTHAAKIGLSLDKGESKNYRFSLPNKIFDYIHAQTAIVASDLPEVKKIVSTYKVGEIAASHEPKIIAETIEKAIKKYDAGEYDRSLEEAALELNWSSESQILAKYFD